MKPVGGGSMECMLATRESDAGAFCSCVSCEERESPPTRQWDPWAQRCDGFINHRRAEGPETQKIRLSTSKQVEADKQSQS